MKFKPEDFYSGDAIIDEAPLLGGFFKSLGRDCADKANARLAEMLKECTVVYGTEESANSIDMGWSELKFTDDTHTARLVCIEPIGEKE